MNYAKIYVTIIAICFILIACDNAPSPAWHERVIQNQKNVNNALRDVDGMKDCSAHFIDVEGLPTLYALRCPNSSVSTIFQTGKASHAAVIVVDGVEYIKKDLK